MMQIIIALTIVFTSTLLIFQISHYAKTKQVFNIQNEYINFQVVYQAGLLLLALGVLFILYLLDPINFKQFIDIGNVSASVESVPWLGITDEESWLSLGLSLSFFITSITATFIYFQLKKENINIHSLTPYLPWILLFSLTNSFSEEIIYRFGVIIPLYGDVATDVILLISAITFGLAHFRGMPSGIVGILMASLLGWLLAKSVIETHGYFWAWSIHFLQDVVIISALILLHSKQHNNTYM